MQRLLLAVSVIVLIARCTSAPELGVVRVDVADRPVFFIREVRGQNHDSLVISASGNVCQPLDGPRNYVYPALGPIHPYYRVDSGTLHLYGTTSAIPPRQTFEIPIVQHELHPRDYAAMAAAPTKLGVRRLEVPLTGRRRCGTLGGLTMRFRWVSRRIA